MNYFAITHTWNEKRKSWSNLTQLATEICNVLLQFTMLRLFQWRNPFFFTDYESYGTLSTVTPILPVLFAYLLIFSFKQSHEICPSNSISVLSILKFSSVQNTLALERAVGVPLWQITNVPLKSLLHSACHNRQSYCVLHPISPTSDYYKSYTNVIEGSMCLV